MKVSRRNFLGGVTASAAALWPLPLRGLNGGLSRPENDGDCVILDLQSDCALRESLEGYRTVLGRDGMCLTADFFDSRLRCRMVIIPGVGQIDPVLAAKLRARLEDGTDVLFESGAVFAGVAEFAAQREMLSRHFEIEIEAPIDLWPRQSARSGLVRGSGRGQNVIDGHESVPYVTYVWPQPLRVRDFSRVVPVSPAQGTQVIGRVGPLPVALKTRVGNGTLLFLGSPLGPALRVGDPEASSWIRSFVAS